MMTCRDFLRWNGNFIPRLERGGCQTNTDIEGTPSG
jgi:hypothetical protein